MTTSSEASGEGQPGAPYLPPSQPTAPQTPAPTIPATPSTAPSAAQPATFDARAMVEEQRQHLATPAYGTLPTQTAAGREAAEHLRARAQRKRRRNQLLGRAVALLLLGGVGAAGWFGYQEYQDQQERDAAARATEDAAQADGDGDVVATADEPSAVDQAIDELDGVVRDDSGGLNGAIDDARDLTQAFPSKTIQGPFSPEPLPTPRVARRPDYRTISYYFRQYHGADVGAGFHDFDVTYDTETDNYYGTAHDSPTGTNAIVSFDGDWRYSVGPDGVARRTRRSELSLAPEPDTPLAEMLGEYDVFPRTARPFAMLITENTETGEVGVDGTPITYYSYFVDLGGFRTADPESYAEWRTLWATASDDSIDLVEAGTDQVQLAEALDTTAMQERAAADLSAAELTPADNQTAIVFGITENGVIEMASVTSPDEDLRVLYVVLGYSDEPARLSFPGDSWVDAP